MQGRVEIFLRSVVLAPKPGTEGSRKPPFIKTAVGAGESGGEDIPPAFSNAFREGSEPDPEDGWRERFMKDAEDLV